jgi:hypothetical protein
VWVLIPPLAPCAHPHSSKGDAWERLQPVTEDDSAFVDAAALMHATFTHGLEHSLHPAERDKEFRAEAAAGAAERQPHIRLFTPPPVGEMVLARPGSLPVYGARMFTQEVFVQSCNAPSTCLKCVRVCVCVCVCVCVLVSPPMPMCYHVHLVRNDLRHSHPPSARPQGQAV